MLLQFVKDFELLKQKLQECEIPDAKIILLVDFWRKHHTDFTQPNLQSYCDDFSTILTTSITTQSLTDLTLPELTELDQLLTEFGNINSGRQSSSPALKLVTRQQASLLFYIGETKAGFDLCSQFIGEDIQYPLTDEIIEHLSELEKLYQLRVIAAENKWQVFELLHEIYEKWETDNNAYYPDRANCLFVDRYNSGNRGRLRVLEGSVKIIQEKAKHDELTFVKELCSPDDPFVGAIYNSFDAVRLLLNHSTAMNQKQKYYHAHFDIHDSAKQKFTGDSIGLAAGLVTYTQLLSPQVMRHEKFISAECAFTGSVDSQGNINSVNERTLSAKIERAFFSPLKYLLVPQSNYKQADEILQNLKDKYPQRRLHIIAVDHLKGVIENHNVIRTEKICIGEYAVKKAYKYSRNPRIQIPILLVLLAIFGTLYANLFPKQMPWFDWNPAAVHLTNRGFEVVNADSTNLWNKEFDCQKINATSKSWVADFDNDQKDEVLFLLDVPGNVTFEGDAHLFMYDNNGDSVFAKQCKIEYTQYPDSRTLEPLQVGILDIANIQNQLVITTQVYRSKPLEYHIRFWDAEGKELGWFVNFGHSTNHECMAWQDNGVFYSLNYNNKFRQVCFYALSIDSCLSVSPPLSISQSDSNVDPICYLLFPLTDVSLASRTIGKDYEQEPSFIRDLGNGNLELAIDQILGKGVNLYFYMNSDYRIYSVDTTDGFTSQRRDLAQNGILQEIDDWTKYLNNIRDSVKYWTGSDWITEGQRRSLEENSN